MSTPQSVNEQVALLVKKGYKIESDGLSGVQLAAPKKMKTLDTLCMIGGVIMLLLFWPIGLLMIVIAIIDYVALTKSEKIFLPRVRTDK